MERQPEKLDDDPATADAADSKGMLIRARNLRVVMNTLTNYKFLFWTFFVAEMITILGVYNNHNDEPLSAFAYPAGNVTLFKYKVACTDEYTNVPSPEAIPFAITGDIDDLGKSFGNMEAWRETWLNICITFMALTGASVLGWAWMMTREYSKSEHDTIRGFFNAQKIYVFAESFKWAFLLYWQYSTYRMIDYLMKALDTQRNLTDSIDHHKFGEGINYMFFGVFIAEFFALFYILRKTGFNLKDKSSPVVRALSRAFGRPIEHDHHDVTSGIWAFIHRYSFVLTLALVSITMANFDRTQREVLGVESYYGAGHENSMTNVKYLLVNTTEIVNAPGDPASYACSVVWTATGNTTYIQYVRELNDNDEITNFSYAIGAIIIVFQSLACLHALQHLNILSLPGWLPGVFKSVISIAQKANNPKATTFNEANPWVWGVFPVLLDTATTIVVGTTVLLQTHFMDNENDIDSHHIRDTATAATVFGVLQILLSFTLWAKTMGRSTGVEYDMNAQKAKTDDDDDPSQVYTGSRDGGKRGRKIINGTS